MIPRRIERSAVRSVPRPDHVPTFPDKKRARRLVVQVVVGMGTLAGSTVMMLSIAWGGSLIVGRCDIDSNGIARDKRLTR
jgi:hypothetical protein